MAETPSYATFSSQNTANMIWKPHLTVAAICENNNRFLLVEEHIEGNTVLNQPAGHVEEGEDLISAVIRETREETAWCFHPEALLGFYLWRAPAGGTYLRVAFVGHCDDHRPQQALDEGILRARWLSRSELLNDPATPRSPLVLRCIDDYLAGRRYPLSQLVTLLDGND